MNNPILIAALAEDRRRQCLCGAFSRQGYGLCPECRAVAVWRREAGQPSRRISPGPTNGGTANARLFARIASLLQIISKGAQS